MLQINGRFIYLQTYDEIMKIYRFKIKMVSTAFAQNRLLCLKHLPFHRNLMHAVIKLIILANFAALDGKQDSYDVELVEIACHFWDCLNLFELNVICHFI